MGLKMEKRETNPTSGHVSRRDLRKEKRKLKKQSKQINFQKFIERKKHKTSQPTLGKSQPDKPGKFALLNNRQNPKSPKNEGVQNKKAKQSKSSGETMNEEILREKHKFSTVEKEMRKQRNRQLRDANKKEEKTIKMLEKQLKLNKRKNQSVPRSFVDSGLDYILDVCDSSKVQAAVQAEMNLQESASEFEEDLAMVTGKEPRKKKLVKKQKIREKKKESLESEDEEFSSDEDIDESSDEAPEEVSSKRGKVLTNKEKSNVVQDEHVETEDDSLGEDFLSEEDADSELDLDLEVSASKTKQLKRKGEIMSSNSNKKSRVDDRSFEEEDPDDMMSEDDDFDNLPSEDDDIDNLPSEDDDIDDLPSEDDDIDDLPSEDEDVDDEQSVQSAKKKQKDLHEDIYGRLRDKEGNIIKTETGKYVPPQLRNQPVDDKKKAELEKLNKTIKGLLNRLAENNMHGISNQIDDLYMRHSRYDMNNTLLMQYIDSLISPVHTPERLVLEHAMLIAVLHANVGSEVGAYFLQHLGKKFDELHALPTEIENKELDNLILLLCHMYTFKIFDSVLLYDILKRLAEKFTPKDVDLILVVLRTVGFSLRKDDPLALKDFIQKVQKLANAAGAMKDDSRVRFMLDILLSIKNNNVSKIPQYDTTHSEHLKKIIKPMFRKGNYVTELKITLEELLTADERGKWWVVGSAWTGPAPQVEKTKTPETTIGVHKFTQDILNLAKKQRMNTANRKNIFCILMTAEDYLDAFEKLLKLGLKGQPEQDIVHVLIHCLLSEKAYNPYYAHIADQLSMSERRHRMTIQYAVWDRFKELKTHSNHQITNLAKFLAHLFIQNSLPLSMLKVLEFTEMDKPCVRLLRQVLLSLLLHDDEEAKVAVFSRVAKPLRLRFFRESIRLFMHHFLLKNINDETAPETVKLKDAISLAEQALMAFTDR